MSCEACGWTAALVSMLAFGTFGVPIKSDVARSVDIDPLVFQTYKTSMCFLTSWLLLLHPEVKIQFTWWGVVSGLFWVPGGWGTVFAIKSAGLAVGIGVGSSFIVLVSFIWGIFIFEEKVSSKFGACSAVGLMICGILGMAYYSSPSQQQQQHDAAEVVTDRRSINNNATTPPTLLCSNASRSRGVSPCASFTRLSPASGSRKGLYQSLRKKDDDHPSRDQGLEDGDDEAFHDDDELVLPSSNGTINNGSRLHVAAELAAEEDAVLSTMEEQQLENFLRGGATNDDVVAGTRMRQQQQTTTIPPDHIVLFGRVLPLRTVGIMAAVLNGSWGGSIMVPMHFAPPNATGMAYVISFGIGASIVNLTIWILRYFVGVAQVGSFRGAWYALPSFHLRKMWCAGGTAGLLWSIGNFASLLSVEFLGEGVGYSVIQSAMLVSGLWGIFYFKEITGWTTISKWLLSATFTVGGILLLSYEHHEG